jgi:hypothetical protein
MRKLILILSFGLFVGTCHGMSLYEKQDSTWTLEKCIEHAFSQNIQIRKSEISNQRFGLYSVEAKAQRLPSVNAAANTPFRFAAVPLKGD